MSWCLAHENGREVTPEQPPLSNDFKFVLIVTNHPEQHDACKVCNALMPQDNELPVGKDDYAATSKIVVQVIKTMSCNKGIVHKGVRPHVIYVQNYLYDTVYFWPELFNHHSAEREKHWFLHLMRGNPTALVTGLDVVPWD